MNPEKTDLDRLLAYRNLLAAEDHCDELYYSPFGIQEALYLDGIKDDLVDLRDRVMPAEAEPRYHCLVKHVATAYEALREVYKATGDEADRNNMNRAQSLLYSLLKKLWGHEVGLCERCKVKEEDGPRELQEEGAGSATSTTDDGVTGNVIQGVGGDRKSGVSRYKMRRIFGSGDSKS